MLIRSIIMSRCQHESPWPFHATRLYRPLLPGGIQGCILYIHWAILYRFYLFILPLLVHLLGSWLVIYISSSSSSSSSCRAASTDISDPLSLLCRSSSLAGLQGYIPYPRVAAECMFVLVIHRSTSLMSSSLLLQECPACVVRLTLIVFVMGGRWPYSWCLVGCCRQDLFNITRSILV